MLETACLKDIFIEATEKICLKFVARTWFFS